MVFVMLFLGIQVYKEYPHRALKSVNTAYIGLFGFMMLCFVGMAFGCKRWRSGRALARPESHRWPADYTSCRGSEN